MTFVEVCKKSDVPEGEGRVVKVKDREIAVFNVDGEFHAIDNVCKHEGGPLGEGFLDDCIVTCPWHAWQYDVKTGKKTGDPAVGIDTFKVKIEGDNVLVSVD